MSAETELRVLSAARRGDPEAVERLYRQCGPGLLALAVRLLGTRMDAEDVLHDVFLAMPEILARYDERGRLEPWLRRVVANRCISRLRRAREITLELDVAVDDVDSPFHVDDLDALRRAVTALPPGLRTAVVLHGIEEWSHAEVAAELGISVGAAQVRFSRGVASLRQILTGVTPHA